MKNNKLVCLLILLNFNRTVVQSITFDSGKEFAQHKAMAAALNTELYFAKPYH